VIIRAPSAVEISKAATLSGSEVLSQSPRLIEYSDIDHVYEIPGNYFQKGANTVIHALCSMGATASLRTDPEVRNKRILSNRSDTSPCQ